MSLRVISPKYKAQWLKWYYDGMPREERPRESNLLSFLKLYELTKSDQMLKYTSSKPFTPNKSQNESIKRLNGLRNEFIHFTPKHWLLELDGLPVIINDCLRMAEFVIWESGNLLYAGLVELEGRLRTAIETADRILKDN